jgi:hypothetical protein
LKETVANDPGGMKTMTVSGLEQTFKTLPEFLENQRQIGNWANQIILHGMAYFLEISIYVAIKTNNPWSRKFHFDEKNPTDPFLTIAIWENNHFQSFMPKSQHNQQSQNLLKTGKNSFC